MCFNFITALLSFTSKRKPLTYPGNIGGGMPKWNETKIKWIKNNAKLLLQFINLFTENEKLAKSSTYDNLSWQILNLA